jgi:hypothetical protein
MSAATAAVEKPTKKTSAKAGTNHLCNVVLFINFPLCVV